MMLFSEHNLLCDPPFRWLDLVCCRSVLIYLKPEIQQRILELFHNALNPKGLLLLGKSESVGRLDGYFKRQMDGSQLYQRVGMLPPFVLPLAGGKGVNRILRRRKPESSVENGSQLPEPPRLLDAIEGLMPPQSVLLDMSNRIELLKENIP
jgi:two-component system, chemotaxis family, CheB/CheR fusion protein